MQLFPINHPTQLVEEGDHCPNDGVQWTVIEYRSPGAVLFGGQAEGQIEEGLIIFQRTYHTTSSPEYPGEEDCLVWVLTGQPQ